MADEELGTGSITISLDDSTADAEANRLGDRLERVLDRASRDAGRRMERNIRAAVRRISPVQIRVEADIRGFQNALNDLNNLGSAPLRVVPDVDRAAFLAAMEAALNGLEVPVRVVPDLTGFDAAVRAHSAPDISVGVDADTSRFSDALSRLGGVAGQAGGALGGLLRFGAIGIAAASAAQGIAGLSAALAPAVGLLAAGPAVILGYQAALGGLKLALSGVGDAFSAALTGSAKEFSKSLEGLSPAAQKAAREVRALKPAFTNLKSAVQDAFFKQIEGDITRTATALQGPLNSGLSRISKGWGNAAKGVLGYVQSAQGVSNVKSILSASGFAVEGLAKASGQLTKGFLKIGAAVSDAFGDTFGGALSDTAKRFGLFLENAAKSGQAVAWVDQAVTVFAQLGGILQNVGSILSGVFKAGNDVGAGFLNNIQAITGSFAEFVNSAKGQEAIGNIFKTVGAAAAQLGPILGALVTQVGAIAPAIGPLFETLGPAIVGLINSLGPALAAVAPSLQAVASGLAGAFAAIGPALGPVGAAVGSILEALSPLLPVIGQLVAAVGTALTPVLSALAAAVAPIVTALAGALAPVLPVLAAAFVTLATALTPLVTLLGTTLGQVITAVAPLFASLATVIAQIAVAFAPLIAQLTGALVPLFAQLAPVIATVVAAIAPLIEQLVSALLPVLPPIIDAFTAVLSALTPILPVIGQLVSALAPFVALVISALAPIVQFAAEVVGWLAINAVVPVIQAVVTVLTSIISAVTSVLNGIRDFVSSAINFFSNLKTRVSSLVSTLVEVVARYLATLPGRALAALSSVTSTLSNLFGQARDAVLARVRSLVGDAVSFLSGLPGKARSALSGIGSALTSAGRDLIQGMINGVREMAGRIASAATDVVQGAVDKAKSVLGISSPSKVFREIGKFVGQGFVKGLQGTEAQIKRASEQLVDKIRAAFKGKKTGLDDLLIIQIRNSTKQLTKLAADRDAIAKKIQKANEFAVSVAKSAQDAFSLANLSERGGGVQGLTDGIDVAVRQIERFNDQVNDLAKRGLRKDLLEQVIGLGPDQGAKLAGQLANATSAELKDLNEAQKQLAAASKKLGRDSADNLFDAGKQASKGFLAGLKAQQKDVENLMLTIARALAKSIRAALGIKSPSKVFRKIGRLTMDGLSVGVEDRIRAVQRSVLGAASAITDPFGGSSPIGSGGSTGGRQSDAQGRTAGGRTVVNNWVINEVGDGEATAQRVLSRMALAGGGL